MIYMNLTFVAETLSLTISWSHSIAVSSLWGLRESVERVYESSFTSVPAFSSVYKGVFR